MTKKASKPTVDPKNVLRVDFEDFPGKSEEYAKAEIAQSPVYSNAITARRFSVGSVGISDLTNSIDVLREKVARVKAGDLQDLEAMLVSQATALDSIFTELSRRAEINMGEYINATDTYMRLALKAQSQCRATVEALAELKSPRPVAYVRQANIANGPQQVNNCSRISNPETTSESWPNELDGHCDTSTFLPATNPELVAVTTRRK